MATESSRQLVDDLDGSRAEVSVTLTIGSEGYRLNLSRANYDKYLAPLVRAVSPMSVGRLRKSKIARRPSRR